MNNNSDLNMHNLSNSYNNESLDNDNTPTFNDVDLGCFTDDFDIHHIDENNNIYVYFNEMGNETCKAALVHQTNIYCLGVVAFYIGTHKDQFKVYDCNILCYNNKPYRITECIKYIDIIQQHLVDQIPLTEPFDNIQLININPLLEPGCCIIKTYYIKIIQRTWKNVYKKKKAILLKCILSGLHTPKLPGLKGMLKGI